MKSEYEYVLTRGLTEEQSNWFLRSLKDLSLDSNGGQHGDSGTTAYYDSTHMTLSECLAISYDDIAELHEKHLQLERRHKSCDALYIGEHIPEFQYPELYFIEFKNGEIKDEIVKECVEKFKDSIHLLSDLGALETGRLVFSNGMPQLAPTDNPNENFSIVARLKDLRIPLGNIARYCCDHLHFILVYNETQKKKLLSSDIDAIIDEIGRGEDGNYRDLINQVDSIRDNEVCKIWFKANGNFSDYDGCGGREILETFFRSCRNEIENKKKEMFAALCAVIRTMSEVCNNKHDSVIYYWDSMQRQEKEEVLNTVRGFFQKWKDQGSKQSDKKLAIQIKSFTEDISRVSALNGESLLLLSLQQITCNQHSVELFCCLCKEIIKQRQMTEFERGDYQDDIEYLVQNAVLIDYRYFDVGDTAEDAANRYIKDCIENGKLDEEKRSWGRQNVVHDRLLEHTAKQTIWPRSFFRFSSYEGLYYKTAATYSRKEFYDKFVVGVCRDKCSDPNA